MSAGIRTLTNACVCPLLCAPHAKMARAEQEQPAHDTAPGLRSGDSLRRRRRRRRQRSPSVISRPESPGDERGRVRHRLAEEAEAGPEELAVVETGGPAGQPIIGLLDRSLAPRVAHRRPSSGSRRSRVDHCQHHDDDDDDDAY